ncbi:MAG: hypothetical protein M1586_00380 [Patescibacteria group bacterium]|nr:hypothetical protein [Patescibacteria group bacterium]MCL5261744.1 hypothetical protein [Patescibacteria group bacterium]
MGFKETILKDWKLFKPVACVDAAALMVIFAALVLNAVGPTGNFVVVAGMIGNKLTTFKIIAAALTAVCINSWLSLAVFKKERMLSWFLALSGFAVASLTLIKVASVVYFW